MSQSANNSRTVSAIAVIDLANELLAYNCIDKKVVNALGSEFLRCHEAWKNEDTIQEQRLPEELLIRLWLAADASRKNPFIGLDIGLKVNHDAKGLLANWVFQCKTLAESFATFSKNIHLLNPSERWSRSDQTDSVTLAFAFDLPQYPDIAIDRSMATIVSWSNALASKSIQPVKATFTREEPKDVSRYQDLFGPKLIFSHDENTLVFAKSDLEQPNTASNPYLESLLSKQATELSHSLAAPQNTIEQVNKLLRKDLSIYCQIDSTCRALHMSRSTLYRKLKEESSSFTELVKQSRLSKAAYLEKRQESVSNIADALGFNDVGSYYRFRKANTPG